MELKFDPGFRVIGEYFESNLLYQIEKQFDSKYSPIIPNPGANCSSTSDSTFEVKMTPFVFAVTEFH